MQTAAGGPLFPWQQNTEWVNDWKFRTTPASRSRVLSGKGVETDKQYTERRKKETTKRTWRSDVADIAHGVGEGVLALHPYTAIPYFGAQVGQDFLNGNYGWQTALKASVPLFHFTPAPASVGTILDNTLEDIANAGSKTARNLRVAREINKVTKNKPNIEVPNAQIRTKIGDVEVDNPQLNYRQLVSGGGQNFIQTGYAYSPQETENLLNYWKGKFTPTLQQKTGIEPGFTTMRPMYSQGQLWFPAGEGDLIVTNKQLRLGNSKGGITTNETKAGTRRVSDYKGEVTPENSQVFSWKPGYGYKRIIKEPSTAYLGDPTQSFLKFVENPKLGRETAANSTFYGIERNLVEELKNSGVDLNKIPREAISLALNKRRDLIKQTAPSSYTLVEGSPMFHFNHQLYDFRNGNPVGWMNVDFKNGDTYVRGVEKINPSSAGVYEKLLGSSILTSQSLGGKGSISGMQLISAPKQYHVLQKFRNRELTPYKGTHTNAKMVYDKLRVETEDKPAFSMLDLSKAGDKETKTLLDAPVWRLKSPTFQTPTKSTVFNPYIIDSEGKMHINWNDILIQHRYGGKMEKINKRK